MYNGYDFYFKLDDTVLTFPITPAELKIKVGSNNKKVTLISEGDINILKSPSLTEVDFEARFPMRNYPYSREAESFQTYWDLFKQVKEEKKPIRFIVARKTIGGSSNTWDTNLLMALEEMDVDENAEEGDDVLVSFKLKQYKEYGVKTIKIVEDTATSTPAPRSTDGKSTAASSYTVKSGDCLWNIAKAAYGDGSKWTIIYNANKNIIESTAKKYGKSSSSNGHWIYPGTVLTIPNSSNASNLNVTKLSGGSSSSSSSSNSSTSSSSSSMNASAMKIAQVTQDYNNLTKSVEGQRISAVTKLQNDPVLKFVAASRIMRSKMPTRMQ